MEAKTLFQAVLAVPEDLEHVVLMPNSLPKLYVKTGCPWCEDALNFLDQKKIPHDIIVVTGNATAMQEMIDLSGQSKAPTLDWDGDVLADFGVDELLPFLKKHAAL